MAAKYNRRIYKAAGNSYTGRWTCFLAAFFVALVFATSSLQAAPILVPSGLNPGDTYHLAFVSSTARDSISANIADYDAHVQAAANAAAGGLEAITWRAIGSTATVNAIDHIGILGPVYRLDDVLLATSEADLWDGSIAAQLNITEAGTLATPSFGFGAAVWTGTIPNGLGAGGFQLGVGSGSRAGNFGQTNSLWVSHLSFSRQGLNPVYAVSTVLTVPIPEPSTLTLLWLGLLGLLAHGHRRRA
ncbi:MAG: PEP-CTERM sorting domain-containing protein [Planctomycetes bacterium]|nr:PEP-CTERM sorting domain-containing protein [Planctomycetota bacterium]